MTNTGPANFGSFQIPNQESQSSHLPISPSQFTNIQPSSISPPISHQTTPSPHRSPIASNTSYLHQNFDLSPSNQSNPPNEFVYYNETADGLFKRLQIQPSRLIEELSHDLRPGNVVEISGTGKTDKILDALVHCIVPRFWEKILMEGDDCRGVLYDLDYTYSPVRLIQKLETWFEKYQGANAKSESDIELLRRSKLEFVKSCMKRLYIIRCRDQLEFIMSLHALPKLITSFDSSPHPVRVLAIDSLSAFFWQNRNEEEIIGKKLNQNIIFQKLFELVHNHNLILLASNSETYRSTNEPKSLGHQWENMIHYRVPPKKK